MLCRNKYGILDDFGEVIRWTWDKPKNRKFIVKTAYERALTLGEAPW